MAGKCEVFVNTTKLSEAFVTTDLSAKQGILKW